MHLKKIVIQCLFYATNPKSNYLHKNSFSGRKSCVVNLKKVRNKHSVPSHVDLYGLYGLIDIFEIPWGGLTMIDYF